MITIDWKLVSDSNPEFDVKPFGNKYSTVEMVQCLVSNGKEVWETNYDPTEGFYEEGIIKFIEIKNINP